MPITQGNCSYMHNLINYFTLKLIIYAYSRSGSIHFLYIQCDIYKSLCTWNKDKFEDAMLYLSISRTLLKSDGDVRLSYIQTAMAIDKLNNSNLSQPARDFSEEILLSAYDDNLAYWGHYNSFKCYAASANIITALVYGNMSMIRAIKSKNPISQDYLKAMINQGVRLFRDSKLGVFGKRIYESIPSTLNFNYYNQQALDHSYFGILLFENDKNLPELIFDYLTRYREEIISADVYGAMPWLITLYNIKRQYPNADFSNMGLGSYVSIFEMIVPKEDYIKYKVAIDGSSENIKPFLREAMIRLNETRSGVDFVNDNAKSITMASRMVESSFNEKDVEGILLLMIIKSDYSILSYSRESKKEAPIHVPDTSIEVFNDVFGSIEEKITFIEKSKSQFLWIVHSEGKIFYLSNIKDNFYFNKMETYNSNAFSNLVREKFFSQLIFQETIKDGSIREVSREEHEAESKLFIQNFSFMKIDLQGHTESISILMDMDVFEYPHNLIVNQNDEPIAMNIPICNILSLEWLMKHSGTKLSSPFNINMWLPIEGGDLTLNMLHSKLEDCNEKYGINAIQSTHLNKPLSAEINIICAHGNLDIALKHFLYPGNTPKTDLDEIIGKGKVLIFFVCHSGSLVSTPYENSISSIVKTYMKRGYIAVIAPFWALNISIPPIWLPTFIDSLNNSMDINASVYRANMTVMETFPTIAAWACMHLYGDPDVAVGVKN